MSSEQTQFKTIFAKGGNPFLALANGGRASMSYAERRAAAAKEKQDFRNEVEFAIMFSVAMMDELYMGQLMAITRDTYHAGALAGIATCLIKDGSLTRTQQDGRLYYRIAKEWLK